MDIKFLYFLSIVPFYESRYTIPILILLGENAFKAFILASILNIVIYFPLLYFLDKVHRFLNIKFMFYKTLMQNIFSVIEKRKRIVERYGYFGLFLLTFLPVPTSGVYTATFLVWLLKLNRTKSFFFILAGVLSFNLMYLLVYFIS